VANSNVVNAEFISAQKIFNAQIKERFTSHKTEEDKLEEIILWLKSPEEILEIIKILKQEFTFDFLSDITAYDNEDQEDGDKRFVVVYQIYSISKKIRIRIKCLVGIDEAAQSIVGLWPAANWLEREVYDMYGIHFKDHPNMKRILMDERFVGHPLRKEFPIKFREPFADNVRINLPLQSDNNIQSRE
jgi:NADH-quinone oxidoreductase subunit C